MRLAVLAGLLLQVGGLHAAPPEREPTAEDVADKPRPDAASGVQTPADEPSPARYAAAPLLIPRLVLDVVNSPIRGALYLTDRYGLVARLQRLLSGEATFSVQPLLRADSDFGLHYGLRLTLLDLFGHDEFLRLQGGVGGQFEQFYAVRMDSGQALGRRLHVRYEGDLEFQPKARFQGIGNGDSVAAQDIMGLIDPLTDDAGVVTRFSLFVLRNQLDTTIRWTDSLYSRASVAHLIRTFDDTDDDDANTTDVYDRSRLIGYDDGLATVYSELQVGFDRRERHADPLSLALPHRGWKADVFAGYAKGIGDDPSNYGRYGFDVQRYFEVIGRDRVLAMRVYGEAVTANIDEIPFVDLPALGGSRFLRGYRSRRFRGKAIALTQLEYHWAIGQNLSSFLLADVGRVFRDWEDVELADFRFSGGAGLMFHTGESFLARAYLAGSSESVRLYLSFSPVFRVKDRPKRY